MKEIFIKKVLAKSHSKDFETAKLEWIYQGAIKLIDPEPSPSFNDPNKVIYYSILYWNKITKELFHAGTNSQYYLREKGVNQALTKNQKPDGNGKKDNNFAFVKAIINDVKGINKLTITPTVYHKIMKYHKIITTINLGENLVELLDDIELIRLKVTLITCKKCNEETIFINSFNFEYCSDCYSELKRK